MSATTTLSPKAVIFDAYGTLFDVHSVIAAAEQIFPGCGDALSQLWRQKQIEYTQLRTLADSGEGAAHYRPFWDITLDALRFSAKKLQLTLGRSAEKRLMDEYACLSAFPDAVPALRQLRDGVSPAAPDSRIAARASSARAKPTAAAPAATALTGAAIPAPAATETTARAPGATRPGLAILSNGNLQMLDVAVKSAGMGGLFDHVLSVDAVRAYKPAPAAYALGTQAFSAQPAELVFVSSNGWDVAGATWFGFTTFWLNRQNAPLEELGVTPHGTGAGMAELLDFLNTLASAGRPVHVARSATANRGRRGGGA
ncbi:HAD family hydrolase [bacterium M00.F.Ca.ET.228.01.1.1]|uniref:HAD-IA family hydrolase n=1 Tax=Paraburkholderia phenoliruptrix TaxID=252970 RepID=UPI001091F792|nr:HAD-IA family hydrolase [Paraburkholderia phenoliruptrix]TGP41759.1 HAD family hydrolase [bacterium M00.F.Ca.ET.228.01.1.1]TGR98549.1 HAD family hydrolase [bacterium M00.F.Ca.ET.191.01.1.1]TGU02884.1 HAD family hydrolase [bacterium M00.F.Ca.ET.155.01.1.1]MBW0447859.1 HAD-IA family hydrolase [Paraburkholderia phenoliruptrix]MBW9098359.1 HAD-IA family hydrolase [Paraburkholderia phenoliruptrix]